MTGWWTVEIDDGDLKWVPIAYCANGHHAVVVCQEARADGRPARIIEPNTKDEGP